MAGDKRSVSRRALSAMWWRKTWVSASSSRRRRLMRCLGRLALPTHQVFGTSASSATPLTWVQSVESCTAKVTKRALEGVTTPPEMSSRLATCDNASSNLACAKVTQKGRGNGWTNLLLSCDAHSTSGCHRKTESLVAEDITGMLNVALACGMTGRMRKFCKCVREHVMSKIAWTEATTEQGGHRVEGARV